MPKRAGPSTKDRAKAMRHKNIGRWLSRMPRKTKRRAPTLKPRGKSGYHKGSQGRGRVGPKRRKLKGRVGPVTGLRRFKKKIRSLKK